MAEKSSGPAPEMAEVLAQLAELRTAIDNLTRQMASRPAPPPRPAAAAPPAEVGARPRMPVRAAIAAPRRGDLRGQRWPGLPAGFRGVTLRR